MKRFSQEQFIEKAIETFDSKFDYSKVIYKNYRTPVIIICPIHGEFEITPFNFFTNKYGCPHCGKDACVEKISEQEFLERAYKKFGNKFDFSKMNYINFKTNIEIICPEHGSFWMTPQHFLDRTHGCPKCAQIEGNKKETMTQEEFIRRARLVHGNKYDYSKVVYINSYTKVEIICPEHGSFWQRPSNHVNNIHSCGCPKCNESAGERKVRVWLERHDIEHETQKYLEGCIFKNKLYFDAWVPYINLCIEYQGQQHYRPIKRFGGEKIFQEIQIRDQIKRDYCKNHNIKLLEIGYWENIEEVLNKFFKEELINLEYST